jgi:hypothetical protein
MVQLGWNKVREMTLAYQPNHSCVSTDFTVISSKRNLKDYCSDLPRKNVDGPRSPLCRARIRLLTYLTHRLIMPTVCVQ